MDEVDCPVKITTEIIGGKWKPLILFYLQDKTRRFSELQKLIPGATKKMLTQRLRELERDEIVSRKVFAQVPPRVEYALTRHGAPGSDAGDEWASAHPPPGALPP